MGPNLQASGPPQRANWLPCRAAGLCEGTSAYAGARGALSPRAERSRPALSALLRHRRMQTRASHPSHPRRPSTRCALRPSRRSPWRLSTRTTTAPATAGLSRWAAPPGCDPQRGRCCFHGLLILTTAQYPGAGSPTGHAQTCPGLPDPRWVLGPPPSLPLQVRKGDTIGQFLKAVVEQLTPQFREIRWGGVGGWWGGGRELGGGGWVGRAGGSGGLTAGCREYAGRAA